MRKKKAPVVLIAALLILVGVVAVVNMAQLDLLPKPTGNTSTRVEQEAPAADERADIKKRMADGVEKTTAKSEAGKNPSEPTVAVPKQEKYKPRPSSMQTSGQWYQDESGASKMPK